MRKPDSSANESVRTQYLLDEIEDAEKFYNRYNMAFWCGVSVFLLGVLLVVTSVVIGIVFPWSSNYFLPIGAGLLGLIFNACGGMLSFLIYTNELESAEKNLTFARRAFRNQTMGNLNND